MHVYIYLYLLYAFDGYLFLFIAVLWGLGLNFCNVCKFLAFLLCNWFCKSQIYTIYHNTGNEVSNFCKSLFHVYGGFVV